MVFDNIHAMINKVLPMMGLSDKERIQLLKFHSINKAEIEVDGKIYPAFRIIHNNALGPGKGGIRFHPGVSEGEVKSLAFWMSMKNSLAGLPFGGGKGGVTVNPKELDEHQLQKLSRQYIRAFHEHLGKDKDIPAPDVYTNPQIMAWMLDEFEKIKGHHEPGFITGKPIEVGGIELRGDSTSRGGLIVFNQLLKKIEKPEKDIRIAVQGFGNAGWNMAKYLYDSKHKIVAVSDSNGGIYNNDGLNITKVKDIKDSTGTLQSYADAQIISNKELLELDVDILVLAALENQITKENASRIKAQYIIELANGPINPEADDILHQKNKIVIPDILANSGGVIGSYFEWANNLAGNMFEDEYMLRLFEKRMINTFEKVWTEFEKEKRQYDIRTISYKIAIQRILAAEKSRGRLNVEKKSAYTVKSVILENPLISTLRA